MSAAAAVRTGEGSSRGGGPSTRVLILAVIAGAVLRFAAALATPVFPLVANTWDSTFYHETAAALAGGEGYAFQGQPTAFFPPGYPAVLSAAYRAAGDEPRAGQILNVFLSLVTLAAAGGLARRIAGTGAARWTILALALEPSQIVVPAFLMSEVLCGALILLLALACVLWATTSRLGWAAAAALAGTAAGLTRGNALLLVPALAFVAARARGLPLRALLLPAVVTALLGGVSLGAWGLRNADRLGAFVPISTNVGNNLLVGNNPNAFGGRADPPIPIPQTGDEIRDEEIARARAMEFIREHPLRVAATLPVKGARLWAFAPVITYRSELATKWGGGVSMVLLAVAQLAHLIVLGLAGMSVVKSGRFAGGRRGPNLLLLGAAIVWTASFLPFFGGSRYLLPIQPFVVLAAAAWWADRRKLSASAA